MAIESGLYCRRLVRNAFSVLLGMLFVCGFAAAQTPVTSGAPIPTTHNTWGQIMKVSVAKNGSVVFLDWSSAGLYQLRPGSSTFTTIATGAPNGPLEAAGSYWNSGMTMDAKDTIYIADRYGTAHFFRIPYNPADGTWDFTSSNAWGASIGNGSVSLQTFDVAFIDSAARDGSGTLVVATETSPSIFTVPVDNQGNWGSPTIVIKGLKAKAAHIAADVNGNIYFIEDEGVAATARVTGVFFIPAGKSGISGAGDGTAEAQITRIDSPTNVDAYSGLSLDAAGNIYVTSQSDQNGGAFNGELMIPNISGSPLNVSVSSFNFNAATFIAPVQSGAPLAIDPRGYLWIPTGTGGWNPNGSTASPGTKNVVLWQMGAANAGMSPVGTPSAPATVYYNFSQAVTPASISFTQPGTGSDFAATATNPIADPTATTPQLPCTPGKQYTALTSCPYFLTLNPRLPGGISGELSMFDASNKVIPSSTTYLSGIGQGPDIALLTPIAQSTIGSGLTAPQQVAADSLGNSYVADSKLGKVLQFASGSTSTATGVSIGKSLTAPTGVAVDGSGDVFIADSGKVIEIPFVGGSLSAAGQVTLATGLGTNLKVAADGSGNVFVTDPDNARVVRIANAQSSSIFPGVTAVGSGFTKPSAIASDYAGNVFIADGTTLYELTATFDGPPVAITKSLVAPVTGLAVDPSGSVDVAQSGGLLHIPAVAGVLNANSAVALDGGLVTAPNGLAIDTYGNLYVSDLTTAATPNLLELPLGAAVNLGQVSPFVPSNPVDVNVYNIGNLPLTIMPDPTFGGAMGVEFSTTAPSQNACDTTGATPVAPGTACIIDPIITAADVGTRNGTMTVTSNAVNAAAVTSTLTAFGVNNLERSKLSLSLNPSTGITYPGSTVVTVSAAPTVSTTTPTGQVILVLSNPKLNQSTTYPAGTLVNGTVNFNLTGILGGTYTVKATYHGDANFSGGVITTQLVIAQAAPAVTLSQPVNIAPLLGVYYVPLGSNTAVKASVTSTKGTPTGSITFLNGTAVADPLQNPVTLDANGNATFSTENLAAGTYNLTAVYNGDQNFAKLASPVVTFLVIPQSLLITTNPASLSITAGTPVQTVVTLTSLVGYEATAAKNGGVFIACDNTTLPKYAECTFDVPQVQVLANGSSKTTLTISSNLPVNVGAVQTGPSPIAFASVFGAGLLGLAFRRKLKGYRATATAFCLALLLSGVALGISGCTNAGYTTTPPAPHVVTPSGSYNVRMYATDPVNGTTKTLPFTLPVTVK